MKGCIFAGTFDPLTVGHCSIINKCIEQYDKVLVVIGENKDKQTMFTLEQRKLIIEKAYENCKSVKVVCYEDMRSGYKKYLIENGYSYYVRGIRNENDAVFEDKYKKINEREYPFVKTVYINSLKEFENVSSTFVKKLIKTGSDFKSFVPENCYDLICSFIKNKDL